jgi:16S rRNA (guanine966-N2)-methyltransferase
MRITGGAHRSRTLVAPRGQDTRPTSDRVREALFSMLASDGFFDLVEGAPGPRVLDLYGGSGALGLEALSRGAETLLVVESDRAALTAIRQNVGALAAAGQVTVLAMRVERALPLLGEQQDRGEIAAFDLALVDPPYALVREPAFATVLEGTARLLAASSIIVLEHAAQDEPAPPTGFLVDRRRRHGDTTLSLFRRHG